MKRVVVGFVYREPGHRYFVPVYPVDEKGGLAEAGRGRYEDKLALEALIHALE
jgi:hypothetical protein